MAARNGERDAEIFRRRCAGERPVDLAREYGLSVGRIAEIVIKERGKVPRVTVEDWRTELAVQLDHLRAQLQRIVDANPGLDVTVLDLPERDGEAQEPQIITNLDYSAQIAAARALVQVHHRLCKLLGLDQPLQIQSSGTVRYELVGVDVDDV